MHAPDMATAVPCAGLASRTRPSRDRGTCGGAGRSGGRSRRSRWPVCVPSPAVRIALARFRAQKCTQFPDEGTPDGRSARRCSAL